MTTPAIRATGLRKTFHSAEGEEVVAVDSVDMLLGLTTPTAGTVEVYGEAPGRAVAAGRVSAVMQTGGLLLDFTVLETVQAIAALHGRRDRVDEAIGRPVWGRSPARQAPSSASSTSRGRASPGSRQQPR